MKFFLIFILLLFKKFSEINGNVSSIFIENQSILAIITKKKISKQGYIFIFDSKEI